MIGQAYIELYKNGKLYERVEQHNTVTNAIEYKLALAITQGIITSSDGSTYSNAGLPLSTKGLGGVWLFDHNLSGVSGDTIHFPSHEAHMVGYAGQSVNTSDPFAGSINTLESGALEEKNGYKNTWDFSTSQANGTIASICLTHDFAGRNPLNQAITYDSLLLLYKYRDLYYNESTGYAYGLSTRDDSDTGLYKYRRPGRYIKTLSPYFGSGEKILDLSSAAMRGHIFYDYLGHIIGMRYTSGTSIQLDIIDVTTWTKTTRTITVGVSDSLYAATMCVCRGYIYVCSQSDTTKMYKVDMESPSLVTTIQMSGTISSPFFFPMPMGGVMNSEGRIIYPDGTYQKLTQNTTGDHTYLGVLYGNGYVSDELWCASDGKPQTSLGYIGTVCNLDEPIVKTAATSMKLVYTIKDA